MPNPYLHVLRTPHALPMVLAAFIGRLPLSMVGLGSVLLIASESGSYGYGGAVAATGAITTAISGQSGSAVLDRAMAQTANAAAGSPTDSSAGGFLDAAR